MSPQPLSDVDEPREPWFCGDRFERVPDELCTLALAIIAGWSCVETHLLGLAAARLEADHETVAEMLLALKSSDAQRAAALAGIRRGMGKGESQFFDAFVALAEPCRKARHKFAHHLLGHSPHHPDCLLVLDPRYSFRLDASQLAYGKREFAYIMGTSEKDPGDEPKVDVSKIFRYSKADLERELRDLRDVMEISANLIPCLVHYEGVEAGEERARLLDAHPRLKAALSA
jgi:hypothetical protein